MRKKNSISGVGAQKASPGKKRASVAKTKLEDVSVQKQDVNRISEQQRDIILKAKYSGMLQSSAEHFIVNLFDRILASPSLEGVNLEVPVTAAMAILGNISWHQPSDAQIETDFTRECIDRGLLDDSSSLGSISDGDGIFIVPSE